MIPTWLRGRCGLLSWVVLAAWSAVVSAQPSAGTLSAIGYTDLQARLGVNTPTGMGIDVMQAEAYDPSSSSNYRPNTSDTQLDARTYSFPSAGSTTASGHATTVARYFYGDMSLAPGISTISVFDANDWIFSGELRVASNSAPDTATGRVQNHSWVGSFNDPVLDTDALRRYDLLIDRDNIVAVVGVNNGAATSTPNLLASAYNVIAVGLTSGISSLGPTSLDVSGRSKPDIVAPASATSWATPMVSGSAALLLQTAGGMGADATNAAKAETVKAVLMAGATKSEFSGWSHTSTQPLDLRYGAGELNIDNGHRILTAGQQEASITQPVSQTGWDFDTIASNGTKTYFFDVAGNEVVDELSIIATWHRVVTDNGMQEIDGDVLPERAWTVSLANIDLKLYSATDFTLGSLIDSSVSTIDNVEHIYQTGLAAGRYAIQLTSDLAWDFALAWDAQVTAVPEPGVAAVLLISGVLFIGRRRAA